MSSERDGLGSPDPGLMRFPGTSEDLHAWSIYRQVSGLTMRNADGMLLFNCPIQSGEINTDIKCQNESLGGLQHDLMRR